MNSSMSNRKSTTAAPREVHHPLQELPVFPAELNYDIASHLQHDLKTLLTLCFVSRQWRDASHKFLFESISIWSFPRLHQFLDLLRSDPHIGLRVRELAFVGLEHLLT